MIEYTLGPPAIDPPSLVISDRYHLLVNIDADLAIKIGKDLAFNENINFIEFACTLFEWAETGCNNSYSFDSTDFEEKGIIRFDCKDGEYLFSSSLNNGIPKHSIARDEVRNFARDIYNQAREQTKKHLGVEFGKFGL